jgi:catechol 2,3-dioxygenase
MDTLPLDLDSLWEAADGAAQLPPETDVGHVHLEVTDIDAARAFYVDTLGFDVRQDVNGALFVAAGGYHHHVGLNVWNTRSLPRSGRGLAWFELVVPADALATVRERLSSAGVTSSDTPDGFSVRDADGIGIRLTDDGR